MKLNKIIFSLFLTLFSQQIFAQEKIYDVVAIGKAMVDVVSFVSEEELTQLMPKNFKKADTNKISNLEVDNIFRKIKTYQVISGGSEANVIADIASLGGKTAFNTIAANDEYGNKFKDDLLKAKVNYLSKMTEDTNQKTALCFAFITPDKDRTFAVASSITDKIDDSFIDYESIKQSKVFYTDASNLDKGGNKSKITFKAIEIARKNDTKIAFNLNNNHYVEENRDEILKLLPKIDIFVGSEAEAMNLFKVNSINNLLEKAFKETKIVVITQGKRGAIIASKEVTLHIPSITNIKLIKDLNGAGDGFIAGFLYGYINGYNLEESGNIASKTAREIIYQIGARSNYSLAESVLK